MRITSLLLAATVLVAACDSPLPTEDPTPQFSATTFTSSDKVPVVLVVFVPCAAGGAGEFVLLEGTLHFVFHLTIDAQGGIHVKTHSQPQKLSGTGLTTGAKYQGNGVTQDQQNLTPGASEFTFVNNFRIIGQGKGNNLLVHQNVHVTINANGELTTTVDNTRVECK